MLRSLDPIYYLSKYRIIRINVFLFILMFSVYYGFYFFSPDMYGIDNSGNITNYGIVNIFYFNTMIHTHVAIGDITPKNWVLKIIVSLHIIIVFLTTCVSLVEDVNDVMDHEIRSISSRSQRSESVPLL